MTLKPCPDCSTADAYIGLVTIECQNSRCKRFSRRWAATVRPGGEELRTIKSPAGTPRDGLYKGPYREPAKQLPEVPKRPEPLPPSPFRARALGLGDRVIGVEPRPLELPRRDGYGGGRGGSIVPIRGEPGRFLHTETGHEYEIRDMVPGDVAYDQVWLPPGMPCPGSQYVFFRDLSGKGPTHSSLTPKLFTNMCLQSRLSHGVEGFVESMSALVMDEDGFPLDGEAIGWYGANLFFRFEVNRLMLYEGTIAQLAAGVALSQYLCSDHEVAAYLTVRRTTKEPLPGTIVSFHLHGHTKRATSR